jgi:DNA-binding response OmpR family regulator
MARGRMLILDDDPTVGQILAMMVQACRFESRWCETAAAFLHGLTDWAPTHLAIDLTLPDTTGVEVLRQVARVGSGARVIVCSGAGRLELDAALAECRTLGLAAGGVLPKPFRLADVRALLDDGG